MPHSTSLCYAFDSFLFDADKRVLTHAGKAVSLTPKATDILILLLRNAGQLVEKDELMKEVWPNTFVEEANVTQNIFTLRRAFDEAESGRSYIETVARRGYRFVADVRLAKPPERGSRDLTSLDDNKLDVPPSLAVLSFINATGDEKFEYLAEGVTDNLTNNLSRIDKLRIISRSAVFRLGGAYSDPQEIGRALSVDAVLSGRVQLRDTHLCVSAQLIEVNSGWQLWGESFDLRVKDILEVQDEIARQISATLRLKLTGEEEKRITTRYTENSAAYQAYLEGRYHWSKYTKAGIEKAIGHFRDAIELDPNYALAYSAIVDCYLRLATNYLPPEGSLGGPFIDGSNPLDSNQVNHDKVEIRHKWDWKAAERELHRANEIKSNYPAAHQWYWVSRLSHDIWETKSVENSSKQLWIGAPSGLSTPKQIRSLTLTPNEEVQILCTVAREQIEVGNFEAGSEVLSRWAKVGQWPTLSGLSLHAAADLLFTTGILTGCVGSTLQISNGQKYGEALLNGALALYEQQGATYCAAEVRLELANCYYRQGLFELARDTIKKAHQTLKPSETDLLGLGLVRLAIIERHAGCIQESYTLLTECGELALEAGPWVSSRFSQEMATTLQYLGIENSRSDFIDEAKAHFRRSQYEFLAIGNHRYAAVVENNYGYLLLCLEQYEEAFSELIKAKRRFGWLGDRVRRAQVDETLTQLFLATNELDSAENAIEESIRTLEVGDEDALLAESLTTKALLRCRQSRFGEAKGLLEAASTIAKHCGDVEREAKTSIIIVDELLDSLADCEIVDLRYRLSNLLSLKLQTRTHLRIVERIKLLVKHE